jgi:alpha-glucosidase
MREVVYQIFVDRFAAGRPVPPEPERARDEGLVRRAWHDSPEQPPRGRDLFGGCLDGVAAKLAHVESLGADAVYLTPVFRAPSNHKYDTSDFETVDEHFGGDAAFARLVAATRARGLGLFLDAVFNHVGERHPWAREPKFLRGSPWRGYSSLPELNLGHPELRAALFGDDGVMARWSRRGATGWRLDCANDLGPELCALATQAARAAGAADGVVGELMAYPHGGSGTDGAMNYWLRSCALQLASAGPAAQVQHALDQLARESAPRFLQASWNVISSHDTPRLETILDGDAARIRQALALAFVYPGVPMIYYGEEIGMRGGDDPANRAPMIWDQARWNRPRLELVRRLAQLRRGEPALRQGAYRALPQPGTGFVVFARVTDRPQDTLLFVANAAAEPRAGRIFVPLPWMHDALPLDDLLGGEGARMAAGSLALALPAHGVALWKPRDDHPSGYRFWK